MSDINNTVVTSALRQAFDQVKPEIDAINEDSFITVTADAVSAATTGQGVYPEVIALRPMIAKELPGFKIEHLDKLKTYALALFCAQGDYKTVVDPPAPVAHLAESAVETRAMLLADVNSLIAHGLLPPGVVDNLQGTNGYRNTMADLATLASTLRKNAAKIADRTSVRADELAAAEDLAANFSEVVGRREHSPQVIAEATRVRQAAYTLFVTAYEEVRSAVQYLRRHEGDADRIIPSLFANRGARRRSADDNPVEPNAPSPSPVVTANNAGSGGNGAASTAKLTNPDDDGPFVR